MSRMGCQKRFAWIFIGLVITSLILVILLNSLTEGGKTNSHRHMCEGELRTVDWSGKNLEGVDCSQQIFREANLSEANLRRANLRGTDFSGAATRLIDTDLRQADLTNANFQFTEAMQADFSEATLREANLSKANLSGARFIGADLQGAILIGANLAGADLRSLKQPPAYLDEASLTNATLPKWWTAFPTTRLCNTTMPDGAISKQGCFWPSYDLKSAAQYKEWHSMELATSSLFRAAVIPANAKALQQIVDEITPSQIRSMPCNHLKTLDQLWLTASDNRFGFSIQRLLWESKRVNRDYTKFADVVGWRQNGTWLKLDALRQKSLDKSARFPTSANSSTLQTGLFPWHSWQVQEPTETQPTRFRRMGFGEWMKRLKTCGI